MQPKPTPKGSNLELVRFRFLFFHAGLVSQPLFDPSYEFFAPQYRLLVQAVVKFFNLFFDLFVHESLICFESTQP